MAIRKPVITVRGGFYESGLEETLNDININFEKIPTEEGTGYKLFNPSKNPYFMIVTESPDENEGFASNPFSVIVASYSESRNLEVLEEFGEKIGVELEESREWEEALYGTGFDKEIIHDFKIYTRREN